MLWGRFVLVYVQENRENIIDIFSGILCKNQLFYNSQSRTNERLG